MFTKEVIVVLLFAVLLVQIVTPQKQHGNKCFKDRICALKEGVKQLLAKRNNEWGWGERVEAEAIIALHLGKYTTFPQDNPNIYISVKQMNIDLLAALSSDPTLSSNQWSRGKLGHYVLGLLATCQNPRDFYGHNLVDTLKTHLNLSLPYFQSNKFAYSLVVLALCKADETVDAAYLEEISTTPGTYTFGVDEAALVYMAYHCVNDSTYSDKENAALNYILNHQDSKGLFGNEYSTALALQAIFASKNQTLVSKTKDSIKFLAKSIDRRNKPAVSLLIFVLPALAKKSFLDIGTKCVPKQITTTTLSTPIINIGIHVFNNLTADYDQSWTAYINQGQTLYDALVNLQASGSTFSFTSKSTTFGQFITSVCNMTASSDDRQYWQLLDANNVPLQTGASQTFPQAGDSYTLNLTTW